MSSHCRFSVLGVPVAATRLTSAAEIIHRWCGDKIGRFVCIRDVHGVVLAQDDPALMAIHERADMVTPDGMPLVLIGKFKGYSVERTCGPDLMHHILACSPNWGLKHYLYGGAPGVAEALAERFEARFPGIEFVGLESPPFRTLSEEEDDAAVRRIVASNADIVWVGLSSPKQEYWMAEHVDRIPAVLIGVGAAFDFHAGTRTRAPVFMQKLALEWLYRLLTEPRRLWRRYLVLAPRFLALLLLNAHKKHKSAP